MQYEYRIGCDIFNILKILLEKWWHIIQKILKNLASNVVGYILYACQQKKNKELLFDEWLSCICGSSPNTQHIVRLIAYKKRIVKRANLEKHQL